MPDVNKFARSLANNMHAQQLVCIEVKDQFQQACLNPEKAMWDPKLRADFTATEPAHNSYGHLLPSGARLGQWNNSFSSPV